MAQKSFTVVFPVARDGKVYKKGETVKMEANEAAYLLARGVIAAMNQEPVEPNAGMPDPVIGKPLEPEAAAKILTADPGSPVGGEPNG